MTRNRLLTSCCVLAGLLTLFPIGSPAQEKEFRWLGGLEPVPRTELSTVEIEVFVRDDDGQPVRGLRAENFKVLHDEHEQVITGFVERSPDPASSAAPEPSTGSAPSAPEADEPDRHIFKSRDYPVYILLYVDNPNLHRIDRNRVLRALRTQIPSLITAGTVQMMIVSRHEELEILQPFTNESDQLVGRLHELRMDETSLEDLDEDRDRVKREIRRAMKSRTSSVTTRNQTLANVYESVTTFTDEDDRRLALSLEAFHEVIRMMTGINGRKHLIYIANGLPLVPGKDLFFELSALDERISVSTISSRLNRKRHFDALGATANAQELSIHCISATGDYKARAQLGDSDSPRSALAGTVANENFQAPLRMLSESTGGTAWIDNDDFSAGLESIRADLLSSYGLSYEIPNSGRDTVHQVEVQLLAPEKYSMRYRPTWVEKSLPSKVQEEVNASLFFPFDENPMDLGLSVGTLSSATPVRWVQPLEISIPVASIALEPAGANACNTIALVVATRDYDGHRTDIQRREHELCVPRDQYEERLQTPFTITVNLLLERGRHQIAVGVLDPLTRRASYARGATEHIGPPDEEDEEPPPPTPY